MARFVVKVVHEKVGTKYLARVSGGVAMFATRAEIFYSDTEAQRAVDDFAKDHDMTICDVRILGV